MSGDPLEGLLGQEPGAATRDPLEDIFTPAAEAQAQEARGIGEKVGWHALNAAKIVADNFAHAGVFVAKALSGIEGSLSGEGFDAGYEAARQQLQREVGTTDPGMVEVFESLARKYGVTNEKPHLGRQAEDLISKRLGKNRVWTDTIGTVLSFAPQTALTKGAVAAARPMANVAERQLARVAASKAGIARETIDPLISSGRAWEFIAQSPGWQKAAGLYDHTMMAAGRNMDDLVGTTAANIAQSFAMAPDEMRLEGVKTAAIASPFMIPFARLGQGAARAFASNWLSADEAKVVGSVIEAFERGDLTFPQMNAALRALTPATARVVANNIIAPAFEGLAFSGITPQFWSDYAAWQNGDPDALSRMVASSIGNVVGVAAIKMGGQHDLAPLFKQIRPDLNTLSTYLEAEANKRAFAERPESTQGPPVPPEPPSDPPVPPDEFVRRMEGEPPEPPPELVAAAERQSFLEAMEESAKPPTESQMGIEGKPEPDRPLRRQDLIREQMAKAEIAADATATVRLTERQAKALERFFPKARNIEGNVEIEVSGSEIKKLAKDWRQYAPTEREKIGEANTQSADSFITSALDALGAKFEKAAVLPGQPRHISISEQQRLGQKKTGGPKRGRQAAREAVARHEAELRQSHGWAEDDLVPMLRGGWEPELADGGAVILRYGRDHSVELSRDEQGQPVLRFAPSVERSINDHGISTAEIASRSTRPDGRIEYRGAAAKTAMDDLSLIGILNRAQGALHFQRLGMREVVPGVYADSDGKYHTLQLDGKTATRNLEDSTWTGTDDLQSTGFPDGGPQWTNDAVEGLKGWLLQKQAVAPSPIEDAMLIQSIMLAHNGTGRSADQLREFFSSLPPEALVEMLNLKDYRMLALEVGSIAAGGNNALHAANELIADMQRSRVAKADAQSRAQGEAFRQEGEQKAQRDAGKDLGVEEALLDAGGVPRSSRAVPDAEIPGARDTRMLPADEAGGDRAGQAEIEGQLDYLEQSGVRPEMLHERLARLRGGTTEATSGVPIRKAGRAARDVDEFLLETMPEVLRKAVPGEKLPYEIRRTISEGERLGDEFMSDFRPGEMAIRTRARDLFNKQERQERRRVRKEVLPSKTNPETGYMRWRLLADKKIEPANEKERLFVESYQKAGRRAYEEQRKAGAVRAYPQQDGPPKYESLRRSDRSVVPYRFTREFEQLLSNPDTRQQTFEMLAGENPNGKMPQYVQKDGQWQYRGEGPVTADALEALHQKELADDGGSDSSVRESAAEHFRMLQNVPDTWKGTKILETDPFKAITGSLRSQGRRAATLRQFGPDIPADARRAMLQEADLSGLTSPAIDALREGRLGVKERLGRFRGALSHSRALAGRNPEAVMDLAKSLMVRVQGGNPEKLWGVAQSQAVQDFLGITNAAMAAGGFRWDLFEPIFRTGAYAGYIRAAMTMVKLLRPRNFREMAEQVDRWGAAERAVNDHLLDEIASAPARAIADAVQFIGSRTERWKQVFNAAIADQIVTGLRRGTGTLNDFQLLQDHLRLSADDMQAVREGKMSDPLASQIRRELTTLFTSRGRPAEGSRFAASRNAALITRFNRFATRRLEQSLKDVAATAAAIKRDGWVSKSALNAGLRLAKISTGMAFGGLAGQAIAYMMTSAARGENPLEGLLRLKREFTYSWLWTTGKAFGTQLVGGPMGQLINAAINNKDPQSIASVTIPGQLAAAAFDFGDRTIEAIGKKDWKGGTDALLDGFFDTGVVPFRGDAKALIKAVAARRAAEDPQTIADAQIVREWRRFEGVQQPYGEKTKPPEFYDSISKVLSVARSMPNAPPKEIMQKGMDSIRAALALAPEESVAAAIEGHMLTKGLSDDQREKLHKWLGDSERIKRVYQHDAALKDLAAEARKLEGTYPTPFQQQLEQVRQQARYGGADRWRNLTERVVDESTQRLLAGDGLSSDIDDLAEAMSIYGEQVAPLFDERTQRFLAADHVDSTAKARRIAKILRERTLARRKETTREQNREANR